MDIVNNSKLLEIMSSITPMEQHVTDVKMQVAKRIAEALRLKGVKKSELAKALGNKRPSEVTRWLSGTQNLTLETLAQIEYYLGISLFNLNENGNDKRNTISLSFHSSQTSTESVRLLNDEEAPTYGGANKPVSINSRKILIVEGDTIDIVFE